MHGGKALRRRSLDVDRLPDPQPAQSSGWGPVPAGDRPQWVRCSARSRLENLLRLARDPCYLVGLLSCRSACIVGQLVT
jgi:hypothetical protein